MTPTTNPFWQLLIKDADAREQAPARYGDIPIPEPKVYAPVSNEPKPVILAPRLLSMARRANWPSLRLQTPGKNIMINGQDDWLLLVTLERHRDLHELAIRILSEDESV